MATASVHVQTGVKATANTHVQTTTPVIATACGQRDT